MTRRIILVFFLMLSLFLVLPGRSTVNSSIRVNDGDHLSESLRTVNGGIRIGRNCRISGTARTVNGGIHIGEGSRVMGLKTVNGGIRLGQDVTVSGRLRTVNGSIHARRGCLIDGPLTTVNGDIHLESTRVLSDVAVTTSDITLDDHSHIKGDIVIKRRGWSFFDLFRSRRRIRIRVREGSVVEGDIINQARRTEVTVILENGGTVKGRVIDARVKKR